MTQSTPKSGAGLTVDPELLAYWKAAPRHSNEYLAAELLESTLAELAACQEGPVAMLLFCPRCSKQHVDAPDGDWTNPPHATHTCKFCGLMWRPSNTNTEGVERIEAKEAQHAQRIANSTPHHAERQGAEWNYQCPTEARECEAIDFCKKHKQCGRSGTPIPALRPAPSHAASDGLALKVMEGRGLTQDERRTIAAALRSRPADSGDAERLNWIFSVLNDDEIRKKLIRISDAHALGATRGIHVGDFRAAIDAAMSQQEPK